MKDFAWSEKFYSDQVEPAWLKFKLNLAEDIIKGMDELGEPHSDSFTGWKSPLFIKAPDGRTLGCWVGQGYNNPKKVAIKQTSDGNSENISFIPDFDEVKFTNPDEGASFIATILREQWQVAHPVFLALSRNPEISGQESIPDNPLPSARTEGDAKSKEQLADWVKATFGEQIPLQYEENENGHLLMRSPAGQRSGVIFRSPQILEMWVCIAEGLEKDVARMTVLELLDRQLPYKVYSRGGSVFVTANQHCIPYEKRIFATLLHKIMNDAKNIAKAANADVEKAKKKVAEISGAISAPPEISTDNNAQIEKLESQLDERNREISDLRSEIVSLGSQIESRDEEISQLSSQLADREDEVCELREDVQKAKKINHGPLIELEYQIDILRNKAISLEERGSEIKEEKQLLANENSELSKTVAKLNEELGSKKEELNQLLELNKFLKAQLQRIQRRSNKVA